MLARGHYGYAFELARRAIPKDFVGRIPRDRPQNSPLYEAIQGLAACYEALGRREDIAELRRLAAAWSGSARPGKSGRSEQAPNES
jgi:hypothetical protein